MLEKKTDRVSIFTQRNQGIILKTEKQKSQFTTSAKPVGTPGSSMFIYMGNRRVYKYNEKK